MGSSVTLSNVSKSFGDTHVVRDLNLEIGTGEFVSLLGPSGCGKTTTLRMVAGLLRTDRGEILMGTQQVDGPGVFVPPERRGLGMVFQSYAIWPHKSIDQNVAYPLQLKKLPNPEIETRVQQALDSVRLLALRDRMPSQLSGGQLQRVALARALVHEPGVLLLDEPLSNLDAALREELRAEIAALRSRIAVTMLYVTHDQSEALALSDRIAVMHGGAIQQLGSPQTIYQAPASPFVARFVGGANILHGQVRGRAFTADDGVTFDLPSDLSAPDGKATLAVRPEDFLVSTDRGVSLPLQARLFLGAQTEYRFLLGQQLLRVTAPHLAAEALKLTIGRGRMYPGATSQ